MKNLVFTLLKSETIEVSVNLPKPTQNMIKGGRYIPFGVVRFFRNLNFQLNFFAKKGKFNCFD